MLKVYSISMQLTNVRVKIITQGFNHDPYPLRVLLIPFYRPHLIFVLRKHAHFITTKWYKLDVFQNWIIIFRLSCTGLVIDLVTDLFWMTLNTIN